MSSRRIVGIAATENGDGNDCVHVACDDGTVWWWREPGPAAEWEDHRGGTHRVPVRPGAWVPMEPIPGSPAAEEGDP